MDELSMRELSRLVDSGDAELKAQSQTEWWIVQRTEDDEFVKSANAYKTNFTKDHNEAYKFTSQKEAERAIARSSKLRGQSVIRTLKRVTMTVDLL